MKIELTLIIFGLILIVLGRFSVGKALALIQDQNSRNKVLIDKDMVVATKRVLITFFALTMILTPGLMMAMQPTWWNRADLSHTYLGVMICEFGTALLIAILVDRMLSRNLKPIPDKIRRRK